MTNSLQGNLPYCGQKSQKQGGPVLVINKGWFNGHCGFFIFGNAIYSTLLYGLYSLSLWSILLTPHFGGYLCFQKISLTWWGIYIYHCDGEGGKSINVCWFSKIITGCSSGMVQNTQDTMLGWQNAATQSFLWYSTQTIQRQDVSNCHGSSFHLWFASKYGWKIKLIVG